MRQTTLRQTTLRQTNLRQTNLRPKGASGGSPCPFGDVWPLL
ncbi:MAG: hypothetical protein ACK5EA_22610 [Planctomycetaceae bacterium]